MALKLQFNEIVIQDSTIESADPAGNITLSPLGSGSLTLGSVTYPTTAGAAGQGLKWSGSHVIWDVFSGAISKLSDLTDVSSNAASPSDGNTLVYDGTSGKWKAAVPSGGGGGAWSSGTSAPSGGNDGDFYLKTDTDDIYKKTSGTWSIVTNVKGAQGPAGLTGVSNAGTGSTLFKDFTNGNLNLNTLKSGTNITINTATDGTITISASGGGSPTAFTSLTDVPNAYSSQAGKALVVAGTEDKLVFQSVGTVTSVGLSVPSYMTATSAITTSGNITLGFGSQSNATFFAGPASGSAAPTFRGLQASDIPSLNTGILTSGVVAPARLGTGTPNGTLFLRDDNTWQPVTPSFNNQNANVVYAGPSSGSASAPAFRSLVMADLAASPTASTYLRGDGTWASVSPSFSAQVKNTFYSGPTSGSDAVPAFRTLVAADFGTGSATSSTFFAGNLAWKALAPADIPSLDSSKITTGTLLPARLASSGTASSSTVLRGDQTWSPVESSFVTQTPNSVLAGPSSGTSSAAPTFRALAAADIPAHSGALITSGVVGPAYVGTGSRDGTKFLRDDGTWQPTPGGGGGLSEVDVDVSATPLTVSPSKLTSAGTFTFGLSTQTANKVWASPVGSTNTPSFRVLDVADINAATTTTSAKTISTTLLGGSVTDTSNFLRADGTWANPGGGAPTFQNQNFWTVFAGPSSLNASTATPTFQTIGALGMAKRITIRGQYNGTGNALTFYSTPGTDPGFLGNPGSTTTTVLVSSGLANWVIDNLATNTFNIITDIPITTARVTAVVSWGSNAATPTNYNCMSQFNGSSGAILKITTATNSNTSVANCVKLQFTGATASGMGCSGTAASTSHFYLDIYFS